VCLCYNSSTGIETMYSSIVSYAISLNYFEKWKIVCYEIPRLVNLESLTSTLVIGTKRIWWVALGKRVTIIIDDDVNKKIRLLQGKLIQNSKQAISFSRVINDVCRDGLKNGKH